MLQEAQAPNCFADGASMGNAEQSQVAPIVTRLECST
jgi:hypothetical protein